MRSVFNREAGIALSLLAICSLATAATTEYKLRESPEYVKERDGQPIPNVRTSEHFALKWGNENNKNFPITDESIQKTLDYFEHIRDVYVNQIKFPLKNSERMKFKSNIYMTETGLKPFPEGYAFGFADPEGFGVFIGEPQIMVDGHNGPAHEFAHAMQGESGGWVDSPYGGWFWECHAQFMAHQITNVPDLPHVLDNYVDTCEFDLRSTRHHYGSWIFLQYLAENPRFGFGIINDLWLKPSAGKDEDPIAKFIRLANFKDPVKDWADLFGDFAKRNVTFNSYKLGAEYKKCLGGKVQERNFSRWRVPLEPIQWKQDWYRIPYAVAPQQNGYNVIPLYPASNKISVDFNGWVDEVRGSDWRVTIVIVNDKGAERFSRTWNSGKESVTLLPNEKEVYLVVAATPNKLIPLEFGQDLRTEDRFPYEVGITGATPLGKDPEKLLQPYGIAGNPHSNGGGFVAATAKVDPSIYVGPNARVLDKAVVKENARIEDYAVISGNATVSGNAVVGGHALVTDSVVVKGDSVIEDYAKVYDTTCIDENAKVFGFPRIHRATRIHGSAVIKGCPIIYGSNIYGNAMFTEGADPGAGIKDCKKGVYTIFCGQEDCDKALDFGGLLASYNFDRPHPFLLEDRFGRGDGFLYGNPQWVKEPDHGMTLKFDGKDDYVELPRYLSYARNVEMSVWVKWDGGTAGQRIFDFGTDKDNCMFLTPNTDSGNPELVMRHGGKVEIVRASSELPIDKWTKITVLLKDGKVTLAVDDRSAGSVSMTLNPLDLRSDTCRLGCSVDNDHYFAGQISGFRAYIKD